MSKAFNDAPNAPKAIGPYSQAIVANGFAFLSGQIPLDPVTGQVVSGGVEAETEQVMKNLAAVLKHVGVNFSAVVNSTIFLTDLSHFQKVNAIYERWLEAHKPARATVQVAALPKGVQVEISMVAVVPTK